MALFIALINTYWAFSLKECSAYFCQSYHLSDVPISKHVLPKFAALIHKQLVSIVWISGFHYVCILLYILVFQFLSFWLLLVFYCLYLFCTIIQRVTLYYIVLSHIIIYARELNFFTLREFLSFYEQQMINLAGLQEINQNIIVIIYLFPFSS